MGSVEFPAASLKVSNVSVKEGAVACKVNFPAGGAITANERAGREYTNIGAPPAGTPPAMLDSHHQGQQG